MLASHKLPMPDLQLICCPYQDGRRDFGMGAGAALLGADDALIAGLQAEGWSVQAETVHPRVAGLAD